MPKKCIYKIPQERQKVKPVHDSNPGPTDYKPTLQPTELQVFKRIVQIKSINKK